MSSIFIFILFVVISILFEGIKQSGNKQKQPAMAPRPNKPAMQPTVAPHRSPGNQTINRMQEKRVETQKNAIPKPVAEILDNMDPEGIQTEGPIGEPLLKSDKPEEEPAKEQSFLDIDINDLQRSVVMTEILGKPKALRKN